MKSTVVAKATFKIYPREYLVHLHQTGPRTFVWKYAYAGRLPQVENFRSKEAALAFAAENVWTVHEVA